MEPNDTRLVDKMISDAVEKATSFSTKKIGDTPTDAIQLVPKQYCDANSSGYIGMVNADGTAGTPFPTGWTSTQTATGRYQIDHNLGTTDYVVVATIAGNSFVLLTVFDRNTNDFQVRITNTAVVFADADFYFTLFPV